MMVIVTVKISMKNKPKDKTYGKIIFQIGINFNKFLFLGWPKEII